MRPAQNTKRVFLKSRARNGTQNTALQILLTAERIDDFPGQRIAQNRVDGKIPSGSRFFKGQRRVGQHLKIPVMRSRPPFRSRHGKVNALAAKRKDAVFFAAVIHIAELSRQCAQGIGRKPVNLAVDIRTRYAQQPVADTAADQHRPPAQLLCPQGDLVYQFSLFCHSSSP